MVRKYKKRAYRGRRKQFIGGKKYRMRGVVSGTHSFKETCELTSWSASATSTAYGLQTYKLNDILNASQFKSIFDLYKITGVKLTIVPQWSETSPLDAMAGIGGVVNALPMLHVAPNRSPWSIAPVSVSDILNDDGVKSYALKNKVSFYLKSPSPRLLDGASVGVPVQTNINTRLWLTTGGNGQLVDQSGVEYFGHRFAIENPNSFGVFIKVYATYYFKMKEMD